VLLDADPDPDPEPDPVPEVVPAPFDPADECILLAPQPPKKNMVLRTRRRLIIT